MFKVRMRPIKIVITFMDIVFFVKFSSLNITAFIPSEFGMLV